ncbi:MAG: hypothetical protein AAF485_02610, partial [Chloroflexota bacterium]
MLANEEADITSVESGDAYRAREIARMDLLVVADLDNGGPPGEQYSVAVVNKVLIAFNTNV